FSLTLPEGCQLRPWNCQPTPLRTNLCQQICPRLGLCTFCQANSDDDIKCSLKHVSLDSCPEYTALSYVWGDPKVTKPVRFSRHRSAMSAFTNMWKWWSSQDGKGS